MEDGASGCCQPAEAVGDVQLCDGAAVFAAFCNGFKGLQVLGQLSDVQFWIECQESIGIQGIDQLKVFQPGAVNNDPDVEKLFPFYPWYHADNGIFK